MSDTVAANLRMGKADADERELIRAAEAAQAHRFRSAAAIAQPEWKRRERACRGEESNSIHRAGLCSSSALTAAMGQPAGPA
ncbi:hypothetical protein [Paenibacillus thiaminolyticus]|uniref:hypothetical protein n=1 Tax=Paenibacillus thiaminolyticus TaxID=49283 RepID=UPI00254325D0|nr:hypothetical protein [Paenibacillus thiaminolyticus]WII38237.1 hypothetical protein O0V01_03595 [Paenibacillus thiaminolyticus]